MHRDFGLSLKIYDMTKAFALNFSMKALFFLACLDPKKRLPKLVRQSLFASKAAKGR